MERILVVGASGLLGSRMMEILAPDYRVYGTYRGQRIGSENMYELEVTKKSEVAAVIQKSRPDVVIDAHGLKSVDYCEIHPDEALRINVVGTRNVAESANAAGCKYVFISTDDVFDGEKKTPYSETDEPHPINQYGVTKLMAERAIESLNRDHIIARTSMLFGKGGSRKLPSFATWVVEQLRNEQRIDVVSDQYSNPTYTDSITEFIRRLCEKDASGLFHIAGKDTVSRLEFAVKLAEGFGLDKSLITPTKTAELKKPARMPLTLGLDISKAEEAASMKGMKIDEAISAFRREES